MRRFSGGFSTSMTKRTGNEIDERNVTHTKE
jgi:hypothetical protein